MKTTIQTLLRKDSVCNTFKLVAALRNQHLIKYIEDKPWLKYLCYTVLLQTYHETLSFCHKKRNYTTENVWKQETLPTLTNIRRHYKCWQCALEQNLKVNFTDYKSVHALRHADPLFKESNQISKVSIASELVPYRNKLHTLMYDGRRMRIYPHIWHNALPCNLVISKQYNTRCAIPNW